MNSYIDIDEEVLASYEVVDVQGRGSTGMVWRVRDRISGRSYALKKVECTYIYVNRLRSPSPTRGLRRGATVRL